MFGLRWHKITLLFFYHHVHIVTCGWTVNVSLNEGNILEWSCCTRVKSTVPLNCSSVCNSLSAGGESLCTQLNFRPFTLKHWWVNDLQHKYKAAHDNYITSATAERLCNKWQSEMCQLAAAMLRLLWRVGRAVKRKSESNRCVPTHRLYWRVVSWTCSVPDSTAARKGSDFTNSGFKAKHHNLLRKVSLLLSRRNCDTQAERNTKIMRVLWTWPQVDWSGACF